MKRIVIKSMVVLSLVLAGTMNTTSLLAQTQETQQVEETPAQRKAREKAEKKAAKEAEKARKAAEKAEKARKAEEEKIAKIIAAQKAAAAKNGVVEEQKPATTYGPEWGENATAAEREENVRLFNFFNDAYNNKDYDKALEYMNTLIQNCPKARSSVYANGANIYRNKIARSKSLAEKGANIDALMNLWDLRLAAFSDDKEYGEVYMLKNKAKDYYKYRSEDKQGMLELFRKAIEKDPEVDATFINQYFTVLVEEYEALNVETDHFMSEYEFMASKMDEVTDPEAKTTFDALLIKSGAADCNNLETIFSERLAKNPDDAAQVEKAFKLMARNNCQSEFFLSVGEKYYALSPSTVTAQLLSRAFEANENYAKALEYLRAAVEIEADPAMKATLCIQISGTELSAGASKEAATWAKKAIEYNAENGSAYLCLAQAYVDGATCEGFEKQTVFWLAYDLVAKARALFESNEAQAQQELCTSLMNTYRNYFPKQADCFFRGMQEGDNYNVNCGWVAGATTVRPVK